MMEKNDVCEHCQECTKEILNIKEAADLLQVKVHTMYYMIEHRQIKGRRVGKEYRFTRSYLLAWLEGNEKTAA